MNGDDDRTLELAIYIGEAIYSAGKSSVLGGVPAGVLYQSVMGHVDLETFNRIVALLQVAGLVIQQNHLLVWIGVGAPGPESQR